MGGNGVRMLQKITEIGKELQDHQVQPPTIPPKAQQTRTQSFPRKIFLTDVFQGLRILQASSYPMENAREALSVITILPLEKLGCVIAVAQLS